MGPRTGQEARRQSIPGTSCNDSAPPTISRQCIANRGAQRDNKSGHLAFCSFEKFTSDDGHDRGPLQPVPNKDETICHLGCCSVAQFLAAPRSAESLQRSNESPLHRPGSRISAASYILS